MDYVENKEDCMKATGIVRRIDDLGRIVIPKEIRRTLRIRETDPMEIYTDMDGQIVLKKYSPMADVSEFAVEYAESIAQNTGMTIAITDRDCVIAAAGTQKKNVQGLLDIRFKNVEDRIVVSESGNTKKLKKELTDRKIPASHRDEILLVCDNNRVLWACGVRRCEDCRVTGSTKNVFKIQLILKERN